MLRKLAIAFLGSLLSFMIFSLIAILLLDFSVLNMTNSLYEDMYNYGDSWSQDYVVDKLTLSCNSVLKAKESNQEMISISEFKELCDDDARLEELRRMCRKIDSGVLSFDKIRATCLDFDAQEFKENCEMAVKVKQSNISLSTLKDTCANTDIKEYLSHCIQIKTICDSDICSEEMETALKSCELLPPEKLNESCQELYSLGNVSDDYLDEVIADCKSTDVDSLQSQCDAITKANSIPTKEDAMRACTLVLSDELDEQCRALKNMDENDVNFNLNMSLLGPVCQNLVDGKIPRQKMLGVMLTTMMDMNIVDSKSNMVLYMDNHRDQIVLMLILASIAVLFALFMLHHHNFVLFTHHLGRIIFRIGLFLIIPALLLNAYIKFFPPDTSFILESVGEGLNASLIQDAIKTLAPLIFAKVFSMEFIWFGVGIALFGGITWFFTRKVKEETHHEEEVHKVAKKPKDHTRKLKNILHKDILSKTEREIIEMDLKKVSKHMKKS